VLEVILVFMELSLEKPHGHTLGSMSLLHRALQYTAAGN